MIEERNAVIRSVVLEIEDHGILTAWLNLDYGGGGQGFGGYGLDSFAGERWTEPGPHYCAHFLRRCMEVVGVRKWSALEGKTVRVKSDHCKVHAIGHVLNDVWFNPGEEFKEASDGAEG